MTDLLHRPWHSLYRAVPPTIEPASRTGLDMFRATVARHRDAVLVHYFDHVAHRRRDRRAVGCAGRRAAAARRRARRAHRDVSAECAAGRHRRARRLEVRRAHRAVQSDAARTRAGQDPHRFRQPRPDLPRRSVRRCRARRAARDRRAADDHHLGPRLPPARRPAAGRAGRHHARRVIRAPWICASSSPATPARCPPPWTSPTTMSPSWCTRRARPASRRPR